MHEKIATQICEQFGALKFHKLNWIYNNHQIKSYQEENNQLYFLNELVHSICITLTSNFVVAEFLEKKSESVGRRINEFSLYYFEQKVNEHSLIQASIT